MQQKRPPRRSASYGNRDLKSLLLLYKWSAPLERPAASLYKRRVRSAWIACLSLVACSAPRPAVLFGPAQELTGDDFPAVLETWTREDKLYDGFDTKLFARATYHAPELRRAFAAAFPAIYGHGGTITRRELADLTGGVEQFHTFFLTAYAPVVKWNDFANSDSIWRLTLTSSNGSTVGTHEISTIKIDENLRTVYGEIGRFDKAYLVRFPLTDPLQNIVIGPETRSFELRIASALGTATLRWDVVPAAAN